MTTVVSIAGKDPETNELYVLIAADSRGSLSGRNIDDNEKKIFGNSDGNYALGVAGKCLEHFFSSKSEKELSDFLNNPRNETKESIERKLNLIDSSLVYITGEKNNYFVSLKEDIPNIYFFNGKELMKSGAYSSIGSGGKFTDSLNKLKKYKIDGRIVIPKEEALNAASEAINNAASFDECTGGWVDAIFVTKSDVNYISRHSLIRNSIKEKKPTSYEEDISNRGIHPYHIED